MRKVRLVIAVLISILPLNFLRVFAYSVLLGYKIKDSKLGFGTIIAVDHAEIEPAKSDGGIFL